MILNKKRSSFSLSLTLSLSRSLCFPSSPAVRSSLHRDATVSSSRYSVLHPSTNTYTVPHTHKYTHTEHCEKSFSGPTAAPCYPVISVTQQKELWLQVRHTERIFFSVILPPTHHTHTFFYHGGDFPLTCIALYWKITPVKLNIFLLNFCIRKSTEYLLFNVVKLLMHNNNGFVYLYRFSLELK